MTTTKHIETENLPFAVCGTCKGHGTHGPGFVYTMDELDEAFGPDVDQYMDDMRRGMYDVRCETCEGKRVVRTECPCSDCEQDRRELQDMYDMERMERLMGC